MSGDGWVVGVDVGGTFTDFYAEHAESAAVLVGKRPSTPDNPSRAVVLGLEALCERHSIPTRAVTRLSHGTTVATNALIQRRGAKVALVTTRGFRDLLEIGRQTRPHMYAFDRDFPDPLVPRHRRFEITERIGAGGEIHTALDESEIAGVVDAVRESGARSCAICFLFAFVNPVHEQRIAAALREALPDVHLSLSCEVQPEFREFERFNTTVLNAYLQPVMASYLGDLEREIERVTGGAALGINQSSGGLMSARRARDLPVRTALSGPAAGVVGALAVAAAVERESFITLDVGGTSADVALVRERSLEVAYDRSVAQFPIRLPMVDIHTIGAGGGSIAWFDRDGLMKVGPRSAGAVPGPACYGLGGDEPTLSDANLLLGRLPTALADGAMRLDADLARRAIEAVAGRLELDAVPTALGIVEIAVSNMVRAIRTISVERGHDPREFALMPFGGAGALHARDVAVSLGMREIIVPAVPGIVCAQGLVVSDLKEDLVASDRIRLAQPGLPAIARHLADLGARANEWFEREGIAPDARVVEVSADMRYVGQNYELPVPVDPQHPLDVDALRGAFFEVHETAYGYFNPDDPIEVMNLRLGARGTLARARVDAPPTATDGAPEPDSHRDVWFTAHRAHSTPVYRRDDLEPGHRLAGPAVIDQLDATTPLYPGDALSVAADGTLIIEVNP